MLLGMTSFVAIGVREKVSSLEPHGAFAREVGRIAHEMAPGVRGLMWVQHIGDFGVITNPHIIGSRSANSELCIAIGACF